MKVMGQYPPGGLHPPPPTAGLCLAVALVIDKPNTSLRFVWY